MATTSDFSSLLSNVTIPPTMNDRLDCNAVHNQNASDVCEFVKDTTDCLIDEGFIQYTVFVYCQFGSALAPLGIALLFLWWLFLCVALGTSADDFFCPPLVVIAKTLRMSDNIAGVTLLAFGNGAPDVFSSLAAITNSKGGDLGLAFGALLGAGIFVTTVVAGTVACVQPFHAMERPMLRDLVFYIASVWLTFYVLYDGKMTLTEAICFFCLYIVYVIVVIVSRLIYQRLKARRETPAIRDTDTTSGERSDSIPSISTRGSSIQDEYDSVYPDVLHHSILNTRDETLHDSLGSPDSMEGTPLLQSTASRDKVRSQLHRFLSKIAPVSRDNWVKSRWYGKLFLVVAIPSQFMLTITTPVVNLEEENHNWNRHLNSLHCLISPLISVLLAKYEFALQKIGGVFPIWALFLLCGFLLALLVFFTSSNHVQPRYHWVFAYFGFIVAVIWIQAIANEIVNILQAFGVVCHLSNAILGLTLLAWGNSIGDLVANVVMARQGKPRTGISAAIAGPMFNLLFGIGLPFTIKCIQDGTVSLDLTLIEIVLIAFLLVSLVSSLILAPILKFQLNRIYGGYLYILYFTFLVIAILVESKIITSSKFE